MKKVILAILFIFFVCSVFAYGDWWLPKTEVSVKLLDNGKLLVNYHRTTQTFTYPSFDHTGQTQHNGPRELYWKEIYCAREGKIVLEKTLVRKTIKKKVMKEITVEEYEWLEKGKRDLSDAKNWPFIGEREWVDKAGEWHLYGGKLHIYGDGIDIDNTEDYWEIK